MVRTICLPVAVVICVFTELAFCTCAKANYVIHRDLKEEEQAAYLQLWFFKDSSVNSHNQFQCRHRNAMAQIGRNHKEEPWDSQGALP